MTHAHKTTRAHSAVQFVCQSAPTLDGRSREKTYFMEWFAGSWPSNVLLSSLSESSSLIVSSICCCQPEGAKSMRLVDVDMPGMCSCHLSLHACNRSLFERGLSIDSRAYVISQHVCWPIRAPLPTCANQDA